MKPLIIALLFLFAGCSADEENRNATTSPSEQTRTMPALVIHGGAGTIVPGRYTPDEEEAYRLALEEALTIGRTLLEKGGTALEAVEATIIYMEDHPLFNAGKGSVYNANGTVENDASIMDGETLAAGAVAGVTGVKNPISLAKLVKDSTKHVMLSGMGAELFADKMQVVRVDQRYYFTDEAWTKRNAYLQGLKMGTVGCVALDAYGNIAAGTSTGGMMHKQWGRIGDSPIIGAGTYANNDFAGVSCTGHGEYFIKNAVAYDVIARMKYHNELVSAAADSIIHGVLAQQGAAGGLIALDRYGNITMPFNTPGMLRASWRKGEEIYVALFGDE